MPDTQQQIDGYRELTPEEIELINRTKAAGRELQGLCDLLEAIGEGRTDTDVEIDMRWLAIARTDLQKGMMALTRSIAKPDGF